MTNEIIKEIKLLHKNLRRRPVKRDNHALNYKTRKYFGSWNNAMKAAGYKVYTPQIPTLPKLSKFKELYYFLGLLLTDGHIPKDSKDYKINLFTSYLEEKRIIIKLIKFLFNYDSSVKGRYTGFSNKTNYNIYISSKLVHKFLIDTFKLPIGNKSLTLKLDVCFHKLNPKYIGPFLLGVVDGDGDISPKSRYVRISSGSRFFLQDIQKLLDRLGITYGKIRKERTSYRLVIASSHSLSKLYSIFYTTNFYYPRKKAKLDKLLKAKSFNLSVPTWRKLEIKL